MWWRYSEQGGTVFEDGRPRTGDTNEMKHFLFFIRYTGLIFGIALFGQNAAHAADEESSFAAARETVRALQDELIAAMKAGSEMNYLQRYRELAPAVREAHHFELIARIILGSHWSSAEGTERDQFLDALESLAVATMASNFDSHNGESFEILETREMDRGQVLLRTRMTRHGRSDMRFDYILMKRQGDWGIINVIVDGVSDLALKRADYRNLLKEGTLLELIEKIRQQVLTQEGKT